MCYDLALAARLDALLQAVSDINVDAHGIAFEPSLHTQAQAHRRHPVLLFEDGRYKLKLFEWGVIADYMNTPEKQKKRAQMCNARSEKVVADPTSYWHRLRCNRCLVPVTGIFEHRDVTGMKNKIPYHIAIKERRLFFLPALFQYPTKADVETGEVTGTFAIITRRANAVMAQIHNSGDQPFRMPLFLPAHKERMWLQPSLTDAAMTALLYYEMPADALTCHPVYTIRTTRERPDGKSKIDAYNWPGLPPLGQDKGKLQTELFA